MLTATKLGKRYGTRLVFRGLNFEVRAGEIVAVIGSNGAGKSTLLKIVAGLIQPSSGRVGWNLESGEKTSKTQEARWRCGLAAPDAPIYRELTVFENLNFFARVRNLELDAKTLLEHLEKFGLHKRQDDYAADLSSGLRVRLQLAVATLHRAPILLLDEPSANLDAAGREILQRIIEEQQARGMVLMATNDPRDLELCNTRIAL